MLLIFGNSPYGVKIIVWLPKLDLNKIISLYRTHFTDRLEVKIFSDGCVRNQSRHVRFLEHVEAIISVNFARRGDLKITLVSPNGTRSVILPPRREDRTNAGFSSWAFMSVHFWRENPYGTPWFTYLILPPHAAVLSYNLKCLNR